MRVNVISGGEHALNALLYKQPDENFLEYLKSHMHNAYQTIGEAGNRFMSNVRSMYDKYNASDVLQLGKMLLTRTGTHFSQDVIYNVPYEQLGGANLIMQRYIMAHPDLSKLYVKNMCSGYNGTYVDIEPGVYGTNRSEYIQVMDGVLQFDVNGGENGYINHYSDSNTDDLDVISKLSILDTWRSVEIAIARGIDPSDVDGSPL
jgi:hypothetical protein